MLILPSIIENITTRRDKTWKITIGTNELSPEQAGEIVKLNQEYCFLAIKKNEFKSRDLEIISILQSELEFNEKQPSQRLRAVLYRWWAVEPMGYKDFELFYRYQMERIIEHYKGKLP
jgi:hypothetical protein